MNTVPKLKLSMTSQMQTAVLKDRISDLATNVLLFNYTNGIELYYQCQTILPNELNSTR